VRPTLPWPALIALIALAGCSRDPRQVLVELNIPYTTDAWFAQAAAGDEVAVRAFLAAGMDPNARNAGGDTALMNAAAAGNGDVVEMLLNKGAQVNATNGRGMTPLAAAILNGHPDVVGVLLEGEAQLTAPTFDRQPLVLAIRARRPEAAKLLLNKGAPAYAQDHQWSVLMLAAFLGEAAIVDALLAKDSNLNNANDEGVTALMYAASAGHTAVARALLDKGAAIDAADHGGLTALMLAANNGHAETTQALIKAGANAGARNKTGATARSLAAANGHGEIAALLPDPPSPATPPAKP
jgi:ankyrin repeat protein